MKKFLSLLLSLIVMCCAVVFTVSMVGCGDPCKDGHTDADGNYVCDVCETELEKPAHVHDYGTEWKSDDTDHWKECSCGEKAEKASHVDADLEGHCDVCGHEVEVAPPVLPGDDPAPGAGLGGEIVYPPVVLG